MRTTSPHLRLRTEGLFVAVSAAATYFHLDYATLLFVALVLLPDLSMAGYLLDSRWGARTYNAVHTYVGPVLLGAAGWYASVDPAVAVALVWTVHIGVDRLFGFGLKYGDAEFGDTHVQRV